MNASRKVWLKQLASHSQEAWRVAVRPPALDGTTRIETRRTAYVFEDGHCVAVHRRDDGASTHDSFLGAQIVGWLVDDEQIVSSWRPKARAILWRPQAAMGDEQTMIALTSPAFAFVRVLSDADVFDRDEDAITGEIAASASNRMSA